MQMEQILKGIDDKFHLFSDQTIMKTIENVTEENLEALLA
jgi:hypothetical protein